VTPAVLTGLIGAIILVCGAAYPPEKVTHPARSVKNWLFAAGGFLMLAYSLLNYLAGDTIFFLILQIFIALTTVLMMLNTHDRFDTPLIMGIGIIMVLWSLALFEGINTVFFVIGLSGIGLGYALDMGTLKREIALTTGSALISLFSFAQGDLIFFWLNFFFALFSGWYALRMLHATRRSAQ